MFQNNGVLKKVSSKGWCKKSIYKTFVNILYSLLKIILIIVGDTMTFSVYIGSVYFLFIFFFCGLGSKFECQYWGGGGGGVSVKIGFSFLVREIFGDVLGVS